MKQHITKEQWDEVHSGKHYQKFRNAINITEVRMDIPFYEYITIGQMIEFLEEGHNDEMLFTSYGRVCVHHDWWENCEDCIEDPHLELCDALWEAVKHKLKK